MFDFPVKDRQFVTVCVGLVPKSSRITRTYRQCSGHSEGHTEEASSTCRKLSLKREVLHVRYKTGDIFLKSVHKILVITSRCRMQ